MQKFKAIASVAEYVNCYHEIQGLIDNQVLIWHQFIQARVMKYVNSRFPNFHDILEHLIAKYRD